MTMRLLTVPEAAKQLGRARSWVEDRIREGSLPHTVYGGRRYVAERDLEQLLPGAARDRGEDRVVVIPRVWT